MYAVFCLLNTFVFFVLRPAGSEDESSKLTQRRARLNQVRRLWARQGAPLLLGDLMVMLGTLSFLLGQGGNFTPDCKMQ